MNNINPAMWMEAANGFGPEPHVNFDGEDMLNGDMDEVEHEPGKETVKRKSRNMNEKKRRDQFNTLINELCAMVTTSNRKMDKTTILKTAIGYLKNYNEATEQSQIHEIQQNWKPPFMTNDEFSQIMLESLDSFLMVFNQAGTIIYVSDNVVSLLGHLPGEMVNKSIYDFQHGDDRDNVYNLLTTYDGVRTAADTAEEQSVDQTHLTFSCRFRCANYDDQSETSYEQVDCQCNYRSKWNNQVYMSSSEQYTEKDILEQVCFCCTVKLKSSHFLQDMCVLDETKREFTSRHSLEWKFLYIDHRGPPIIGYLLFELLGTSGYEYYHPDDLEKVSICHRQLLESGKGTSCYYRFLTKGQQWVWLQTQFFITYNQWNNKPENIVCTNTVVNWADINSDEKDVIGDAHTSVKSITMKPDRSVGLLDCGTTSNTHWLSAYTEAQISPNYKRNRYSSRAASTGSDTDHIDKFGSDSSGSMDLDLSAYHFNGQSNLPAISTLASNIMTNASTILQQKQKQLQQVIQQQQKELQQISEQLMLMGQGGQGEGMSTSAVQQNTNGFPIQRTNPVVPTATVCPTPHSRTSTYVPSGDSSTTSQSSAMIPVPSELVRGQHSLPHGIHSQGQPTVSSVPVVGDRTGCQTSAEDHAAVMMSSIMRTQSTEDDMAAIDQIALTINSAEQQEPVIMQNGDSANTHRGPTDSIQMLSPNQCMPVNNNGNMLPTPINNNAGTTIPHSNGVPSHHLPSNTMDNYIQSQQLELQLQQLHHSAALSANQNTASHVSSNQNQGTHVSANQLHNGAHITTNQHVVAHLAANQQTRTRLAANQHTGLAATTPQEAYVPTLNPVSHHPGHINVTPQLQNGPVTQH